MYKVHNKEENSNTENGCNDGWDDSGRFRTMETNDAEHDTDVWTYSIHLQYNKTLKTKKK